MNFKRTYDASGEFMSERMGLVRVPLYTGATDIKSITDYAWSQVSALGLQSRAGVCFRADYDGKSAKGPFGTSSHQVFAWFSSINYGMGFMLSDNAISLCTFRRAGGPNSNYCYKVTLTSV